MRLRLPLWCLNLEVRARMSSSGSREAIYLPDCPLSRHIKSRPKGEVQVYSTDDDAYWPAEFESFANTEFWNGNSGYNFIEKHLPVLVSKETRLLDVGCSLGHLPFFLKHLGLWDKIAYCGLDVDKAALDFARAKHPHGVFEEWDIHGVMDADKLRPDILFTKGTLCSTYYPDIALKNVLSIQAEYFFLVHNLISDKVPKDKNFVSALMMSDDDAYVFTILGREFFFSSIKEAGLEIVFEKKQLCATYITNFGKYHTNHILLRKSHG